MKELYREYIWGENRMILRKKDWGEVEKIRKGREVMNMIKGKEE